MKPWVCAALVLLSLMLMGSNCREQIVRDKETYKAEVTLLSQLSIQEANILYEFIQKDCKCVKGDFPSEQCTRAAVIVTLVRRRVQWHADMMLFNAGILTERPSLTEPSLPPPQDLCPKEAP